MNHLPYIGSGPYCYANSFSMMFGVEAPSTAVIETVTGGPFGMQLIGGKLPFFDPYGWNPEAGFEGALAALGWTSTVTKGGDSDQALARLRAALSEGPVWVGPVEIGHLRHQPGMTGPIGSDHYVVALAVDDERVLMHDPQGFPYATLPVADFMVAWRAETIDYATPYTMRTGFARTKEVPEADSIRASIPAAIGWLSMEGDHQMPPSSLGNGEAAEALARIIEAGCDDWLRGHFIYFAVRVGARRVADASMCLKLAGYTEAAGIMAEQARLIGSMQHPLVVGNDSAAAATLRALAPTYDELLAALRRPN